MLPAGHVPVIPPFTPAQQQQLLTQLGTLRRLVIDLTHAQQAGLPVHKDLADAQAGIKVLEQLYQSYFPAHA